MNKDKTEKWILDMIFQESDITKSEQPDFIIKKSNSIVFGVEITQLFFDESNARVHCNPKFFDSINKDGTLSNKKDESNLKVVTLTSIPKTKDEKPITVKGIVNKNPPNIPDILNRLCEVIETKDLKFEGYNKDLSYIDLIIFDYEHPFISRKAINFNYRLLYIDRLKKAVVNTNFREIYLITQFDTNELEYIDLRTEYFIEMFYLYNNATGKFYKRKIFSITTDEFLRGFAYLLMKYGFKSLYYSLNGVPALYFSYVKATIDYNNSFFLRAINKIPSNTYELNIENCANIIDDSFIDFFREYEKTASFQTKITKNINKPLKD